MQQWDSRVIPLDGYNLGGAELHATNPSGIDEPQAAEGEEGGAGGAAPARYCAACGHALREDDKFCSACGTPTGAGAAPSRPNAEVTWEYCHITCYATRFKQQRRFLGVQQYQTHFVAAGIGPHGLFRVPGFDYPGHVYYGSDDANVERGRDAAVTAANAKAAYALVKALTEQGWEPLPEKGRCWYNYTFRRRASG